MIYGTNLNKVFEIIVFNSSKYFDFTTKHVQLLNQIKTISEQSVVMVKVLRAHSINSHDHNDISKNVNKSSTNIKTHLTETKTHWHITENLI